MFFFLRYMSKKRKEIWIMPGLYSMHIYIEKANGRIYYSCMCAPCVTCAAHEFWLHPIRHIKIRMNGNVWWPLVILNWFLIFPSFLRCFVHFFFCKGGCLVTVYGAMMRPVLERAWENCETAIAEGGGTPVGDVLNISWWSCLLLLPIISRMFFRMISSSSPIWHPNV